MKTVIHWFRRDLRITDNTAFARALRAAEQVVPVYVVGDWNDRKRRHRWTGPNRQEFLRGCLESLDRNLERIGGKLIFRRGEAVEELCKLVRETGAERIYFNRDPDPFGRDVETRLAQRGNVSGFETEGCRDAWVRGAEELLTGNGGPYRVFTPYAKAWRKLPLPAVPETGAAPRGIRLPAGIPGLPVPVLADWGLASAADILPAGERAARKRLRGFLSAAVREYGKTRDLLGVEGTSRISQDLRFGLLSIREVFQSCEQAAADADANARGSIEKFTAELIWREFYLQILRHFPEVLEKEFNPKFRDMEWPGRESDFERWCAGETGFPIVDAGMRQLRATGWMHNRARMITAMFLTKDLHLDWRRGEQWFMRNLVDGEIASNNGGWQWSAGTGADAAPYFRIQNPWTQIKRHDPAGAYIKRWVPELRDVPAAKFMTPPESGARLAKAYPPPIVDHARERERTLELFG